MSGPLLALAGIAALMFASKKKKAPSVPVMVEPAPGQEVPSAADVAPATREPAAPVQVAPSPAAREAAASPGEVVSEVERVSSTLDAPAPAPAPAPPVVAPIPALVPQPVAPAAGPPPIPALAPLAAAPVAPVEAEDLEAEVAPGGGGAPVAVAPTEGAQQASAAPGVTVEEVVQDSPVQAARDLAAYARDLLARKKGAQLGTRGAPSARVRELQAAMGGIPADGQYGPATRARGEALGVQMPVRR